VPLGGDSFLFSPAALVVIVSCVVEAVDIHFPDPEFDKGFRVYSNYLEDLAGVIGGGYGLECSLVDGVRQAMRNHPPLSVVQRRAAVAASAAEIEGALRKAWSMGGRVAKEVEADEFDSEANAWLPEQAYYAVHHGMRAVVLATTGSAPKEHRRILNVISREVVGRRVVFPWDTYCTGCPQLGTEQFTGVGATGDIQVLSAPDPDTAEERIAKLLATTRRKELDRRFAEQRSRKPSLGRSRRNLSRAQKSRLADNLPETTLFDFFFRTRKKVHYDEPDTFVLGAAGPKDARRFAESLAIVTDGTLAVLECLVAAYVGDGRVATAALNYADQKNASPESLLGRRAAAWGGVVPAEISD
jgi:hypothetical protein